MNNFSSTTPSDIKHLSPEQFPLLANALREKMISVVSKNGGHLASSLGVVELTIALLNVFDPPKDKIIWDVGHQSYAYKMVTQGTDAFETLRQWGGLCGFPKMDEGPYNAFGVGHSSTSISAALGIAAARDLQGDDYKVIAVIGDGSMTGGLAFEGLNNAGHCGKDMLVILNDNERFISERVGAVGTYLAKVLSGSAFMGVEEKVEKLALRIHARSEHLMRFAKRFKTLFTPGTLFEEMGFCYLGPVDGHNTESLVTIFQNIKKLKGPVLLHVVTKKGKGYEYAENDPLRFHGVGKFDCDTGTTQKTKSTRATYTDVFGETLVRIAEKDSRVVAITAAMASGTGLDAFAQKFPSRFFDVGIAEGHALTFAAGLAAQGMKPVCALYSTFLQRAYDQIIHDVCLQKLPVVMAIDRAGIVGEDGATHNGMFDISFLRPIPNLVVMAPSNERELAQMLVTACASDMPCAIRYPRSEGCGVAIPEHLEQLPIGVAEMLRTDGDIGVIALGSMVGPAIEACDMLEKKHGIACKLMNARFVKPLDATRIRELAQSVRMIVTIEENVLLGGFGSAVRELLAETGEKIPVHCIGLPDTFIPHGSRAIIFEHYGLTPEEICRRIMQHEER